MRLRLITTLTVLALLGAACTEDRSGRDPDADAPSTVGAPMLARTTPATFRTLGTIGQVYITKATPGSTITVYDDESLPVGSGTVDELGSLIIRDLDPAAGYRAQERPLRADDAAETSDTFSVTSMKSSKPPRSLYTSQHLDAGFQYLTMRDGTTLSASVYLPGPADAGPYPTVVEYSGYTASNPTNNLKDQLGTALAGSSTDSLCKDVPIVCHTPDQPASMIAYGMGYAVVAVNMRGTGCSGGAYDFFEPLQRTDGYDIIETVASQPWVKHGKVGMVGLSYPGLSQLWVAAQRPPHLAAITPLSVFDDTARSVLAPGGIFNSGFALSWARNVLDEAKPEGQKWTRGIIDGGDTVCAANQNLRLQNVDAAAKAEKYTYYEPEVADPLNPSLFVHKIDVPVFLTGAWQDEQTGPSFANLFDKFTDAPVVKFTAMNGAHADGFAPDILVEWKAFLDFYVAGERSPIPTAFRTMAPLLMNGVFGTTISFPKERWLGGDFKAERKAFEAEDPIRIIFEAGGGEPVGAPVGRWETHLASWPPPVTATSYWLGPEGTMSPRKPPVDGGVSRWTFDPDLGRVVTLPGENENDAFLALPRYQWEHDKAGGAAVFLTEPLRDDVVVLGNGNADLWVRTSGPDADLGLTLSEVRPDGRETYVQSGFLRLRMRKLAKGSTELRPLHSALHEDSEAMPVDAWTRAQVEVLPAGHIFRAGSRIRLSIHTPGGDKPRWAWILPQFETQPTIDIGHDADHPSRLILGRMTGLSGYPQDLPPCPSLRGEPCRIFEPYSNQPAPVG